MAPSPPEVRAPTLDLMATDPAPVLVTIRQAATMLGVGRDTVYAMIERGDLDSRKIGPKGRRITVASIHRFANGA